MTPSVKLTSVVGKIRTDQQGTPYLSAGRVKLLRKPNKSTRKTDRYVKSSFLKPAFSHTDDPTDMENAQGLGS
jgi:hypothetical protein